MILLQCKYIRTFMCYLIVRISRMESPNQIRASRISLTMPFAEQETAPAATISGENRGRSSSLKMRAVLSSWRVLRVLKHLHGHSMT
jgi:hypothetical protein